MVRCTKPGVIEFFPPLEVLKDIACDYNYAEPAEVEAFFNPSSKIFRVEYLFIVEAFGNHVEYQKEASEFTFMEIYLEYISQEIKKELYYFYTRRGYYLN